MNPEKDDRFRVTSGSKEYLPKASEVITKCFYDDPVIRYMMSSLSEEARLSYFPSYMHSLLKAASLNDAVFEEANDWSCAAVWMKPGKRVDNPLTLVPAGFLTCLVKLGFGGCKRMLWDFQNQSDKCKKEGLRDKDGRKITRYHYLFFIATNPEARGQGLASKMVARYQQRSDGLPIWLEATTKKSRDIYERCGFQEIREMKVGVGTHASNGVFEKDGAGISSMDIQSADLSLLRHMLTLRLLE